MYVDDHYRRGASKIRNVIEEKCEHQPRRGMMADRCNRIESEIFLDIAYNIYHSFLVVLSNGYIDRVNFCSRMTSVIAEGSTARVDQPFLRKKISLITLEMRYKKGKPSSGLSPARKSVTVHFVNR